MYYEGLGVTQNQVKAHILWKLASANSDVNYLKNSSKYRSVDENKEKTNNRNVMESKQANKIAFKTIRTN